MDTFIETNTDSEQVDSYNKVYGQKVLKKDTHGELQCYRAGCSCELCKAANTKHAKLQREQRLLDDHRIPHGTESGYVNWKCRCEKCRKANRERVATYQKRVQLKAILDPNSIKHGTFFGYSWQKCRCEICVAKIRTYYADRRKDSNENQSEEIL